MFDYSLLGDRVNTPDGAGQYLDHKNGKVLVVMDWDCPPVEYDGDEVYVSGLYLRFEESEVEESEVRNRT